MHRKLLWGLFLSLSLGFVFTLQSPNYSYYRDNIQVDLEIRPYFDQIVKEVIRAGVKIDLTQPIKITLVDEPRKGVIGVAHGMFDTSRVEITIDRAYWTKFNDVDRKWVLIHEMGHDFWGIFHHGDGIMRPYHLEGETRTSYGLAFAELMKSIYNWQNRVPLSQIA